MVNSLFFTYALIYNFSFSFVRTIFRNLNFSFVLFSLFLSYISKKKKKTLFKCSQYTVLFYYLGWIWMNSDYYLSLLSTNGEVSDGHFICYIGQNERWGLGCTTYKWWGLFPFFSFFLFSGASIVCLIYLFFIYLFIYFFGEERHQDLKKKISHDWLQEYYPLCFYFSENTKGMFGNCFFPLFYVFKNNFFIFETKNLIWQPKMDRKQNLFSKLNLWRKLKTCKILLLVSNF